MILNQESLFILLSGFAKSCIESDSKGNIQNIANVVNRYFSKRQELKNLKEEHKITIATYINHIVEPRLEELQRLHNGKTSPQILLVLGLDMLINEYSHTTSRVAFGHFKKDIMLLVDKIYSDEQFKPYIKTHSDFIGDI